MERVEGDGFPSCLLGYCCHVFHGDGVVDLVVACTRLSPVFAK